MAGWLKRVGGSCLEGFNLHQNVEQTKPIFDHEPLSKGPLIFKEQEETEYHCKKLESLFNEFLPVFAETILGASCARSLPPMLGDGQSVDLFRLYLNVIKRGGFEKVSENGQWDSVAKVSGFDSIAGPALKLVYVKYLGELSKALEINFKGKDPKSGTKLSDLEVFGGILMDLESDFKGALSGISDKKEKNVGLVDVELKTDFGLKCHRKFPRFHEDGGFMKLNGNVDESEEVSFVKDGGEVGDESANGKGAIDDIDKVFVGDNIGQVSRIKDVDMVSDASQGREEVHSRKRRQQSYFGMLNWIHRVAMDPCDPEIGTLPESSMWKCYAADLYWKQVLLVRQAVLSNRNCETGDQAEILQKKQKMHPTMYDDPSERPRFSQRILSAKDPSRKSRPQIFSGASSMCTQSDDTDESLSNSSADSDSEGNFMLSHHRKKRIPIGPSFQADVSEWTGKTCESDSKWLGTRMWPLERAEQNRNLIERERVGKGRQDSCGCQFPGSIACTGFHVSEKRMRLKLELGPAFYRWKFGNMGEEVALSWAKEEQLKFKNIVESNPLFLGKYFWNEIVKSFPSKSRESLVSYYYNVFLVQRRAQQNRITPNDINSDDDESEVKYDAGVSPGSIFCSPKKSLINIQ